MKRLKLDDFKTKQTIKKPSLTPLLQHILGDCHDNHGSVNPYEWIQGK